MKNRLLPFAFLLVAVCLSGCSQNKSDQQTTSDRSTPRPATPTPRPTRSPTPTPTPSESSELNDGGDDTKHRPEEGGGGGGGEGGKALCKCMCEGELLWERELTDAECKSQCPAGQPCG